MVDLTDVTRHFAVAAGCDALYSVADEGAGHVGYIVLHHLRDGRAFGGIRRLSYGSPREAVADVVRLAEQMTLKTAFAGLPVGGGKATIVERDDLSPERAYRAMGAAVARLEGAYFCGPDVGTGPTELAWIREHTDHVNDPDNQPAASTAAGVMAAIDAVLAHLGRPASSVHALVQGIGSIGGVVADGLVARGARVAIADVDEARVSAHQARHPGVEVVSPAAALETETDLLAPCALGPVVTRATLAALRCAVICGGANNQLDDPSLALALMRRKITYVPDFAINAGAVIEGVMVLLGADPVGGRAEIDAAIAATGDRVASVLAEARATGMTPLEIAFSRLDDAPAS